MKSGGYFLMKWLTVTIAALLLVIGSSCSRDPEVVKRKYVENGNKYFERGKYKEASIMYRSALKKDLKYGEAYYRLALTQLKLGQLNMAVRALSRAAGLPMDGPEREDARKRLADIYLGAYLSDRRKNQSLRLEIEDLATKLASRDPSNFHALRIRGYLADADGDRKKALEFLQKANAVKPMDPDLTLNLVQLLIAVNRVEEGEKLAMSLIEKQKSYGPMYDALFVHYVTQKRLPDAEGIRKLKVANNPGEISYHLELARFYYLTGRAGDGQKVLAGLLVRAKDFKNTYLTVGDNYRRLQQFDDALRTYRSGADSGEGSKVEFQQRIAEILAAQGKRPEASKVIGEILKQDSKNPSALALRATMNLETGSKSQLPATIAELQSSVSQMPRNAVVRFNLGRALMEQGNYDQARVQFEEAVRLRADYLPARLWLGQVQLVNREWAKSLQTANEVQRLSPNNLQARMIRAISLREMGNYDQARSELAGIVNSNPASVDARFQLAILDLGQKKFAEAEKGFQQCATASSPADLRCLMGLVKTYNDQGQFERTIGALTEARKRAPENVQVRMALANTTVSARKYDLGIGIYNELLAQSPNSAELHLRLGEAYRRKGDSESAIRHFRKAKDLNPDDARIYIPLGMLYDMLGRKAEAQKVYAEVIKLQPDNGIALNNLAYLIAETGQDLDVALTYAQRAKQKFPKDPNVADTLGWIYIRKNLSANAIQIYQELVTAVPQNPVYRFHMAMALYQKGDKVQAKRELETALRNKPSKEDAAKIRDLLARIG